MPGAIREGYANYTPMLRLVQPEELVALMLNQQVAIKGQFS